MNNLYELQRRLERDAIAGAKAQRQAELDRTAASHRLHKTSDFLVRKVMGDTTTDLDIMARLNKAMLKTTDLISSPDEKIKTRTDLLPVFTALDPQVIVMAGVDILYGATLAGPNWDDLYTLPALCEKIGEALRLHYMQECLRDEAYGKKVLDKIEATRPRWQGKLAAFSRLVNRAEHLLVVNPDWDLQTRINLGNAVLKTLTDFTTIEVDGEEMPLFEMTLRYQGMNKKKCKYQFSIDPVIAEAIEEAGARWVNGAMAYPISVVPPNPMVGAADDWTPYDTLPATMIKQSMLGAHDSDDETTLSKVSPITRRSIDAMANTPWRINVPVLEVVEYFWHEGKGNAGMPLLPSEPTTRQRGQYASKRAAYKSVIEKAQEYAGYDTDMYFPHNVDFRSRAYPLPTGLTPQGQDIAKGLLIFSHGKALTASGWRWLKIHVANSFGQDSGPLNARLKWVELNHDMIMACAEDPYTNDGWRTGDAEESCVSAIAAAFEYAAAVNSGNPETYVSRLQVQIDGKCNGLQHHAAATRCSESGPLVALAESDSELDIYETNAEYLEANRQIDEAEWRDHTEGRNDLSNLRDLPSGRKYAMHAEWWAGKLKRKIAKLPTMTKPYGVSDFGMAEQVRDKLVDMGLLDLDDKDLRIGPLCNYFVSLANDTLWELMPGPADSMTYIQTLVQKLAANDEVFRWTTPAGDIITMRYPHSQRKLLNCWDRTMWIHIPKEGGKQVKGGKQRNAASANWVHSRDAAHMHLTIGRCLDGGIRHFSMIHDSFGTHAADVEAMGNHLRAVFVDMYTGNVFEELEAQVAEYTTVPDVKQPELGSLDVTEVLESELFFC